MALLYTFRPVGDGVEDDFDTTQLHRILRPRIGLISHDMVRWSALNITARFSLTRITTVLTGSAKRGRHIQLLAGKGFTTVPKPSAAAAALIWPGPRVIGVQLRRACEDAITVTLGARTIKVIASGGAPRGCVSLPLRSSQSNDLVLNVSGSRSDYHAHQGSFHSAL